MCPCVKCTMQLAPDFDTQLFSLVQFPVIRAPYSDTAKSYESFCSSMKETKFSFQNEQNESPLKADVEIRV